MNTSDDAVREIIAHQAGEWFVAHRTGPLDAAERHAFNVWLKASPLHVAEYLEVASVGRLLPAAADDPEMPLAAILERVRSEESGSAVTRDTDLAAAVSGRWRTRREAARVPRRALSRALAAAALLVAVATGLFLARDGEHRGLASSYRTAHGEQRLETLPDGSLVRLNTDSEIIVRYARNERLVELVRGQALFEVAHKPGRPFRVTAGEAAVLAVGTRFDVYRRPEAVIVTVTEGTVAVFPGRSQSAAPAPALRLGAGFQVEVRGRVGEPRPINPHLALAWLERKIAFDDEALGEVAAEFNRYGRVGVEIDDQSLRALPISGVFDAYDTDSFAAFLETLNGVVVQKTPTRIRVLPLASATTAPLAVRR